MSVCTIGGDSCNAAAVEFDGTHSHCKTAALQPSTNNSTALPLRILHSSHSFLFLPLRHAVVKRC